VIGLNLTGAPNNDNRSSLSVISLASDPGALALGPQLAVFAASLGIPTALVVGPQQDPNFTATLRTACAEWSPPAGPGRMLRVAAVDDRNPGGHPAALLSIVVSVVDGEQPEVPVTMRTTATVLAVSAGGVTAEQLARVAVSAASDGRDIAGFLVANPDPTDQTTGRIPQMLRWPPQQTMPTRLTGTVTEAKR
jgi:hypothetical protein